MLARRRQLARGGAAAAVISAATLAATLAGPTTAGARSQATPAKPNVIVIETDDQTASTLRAMPNVSRLLAAQGVTFTESFATWPLCCPSRATFLTGQYAHNHQVLGNTPPLGGYDRLDHSNTLPVWLQRAGYHTALVGKYLNGYGRRGRQAEIPPGWSEWYGSTRNGFLDHTMNENGRIVTYGTAESDYSTDVYARRAVEIVRRRAPEAAPFLVWLTPFAPHSGRPADPDDPPRTVGRRLPGAERGIATTSPAPRHRDRFAATALPMPPSFNEADVSDKPAYIRNAPSLTAGETAAIREAYQQQLESLLAIDDAVASIVAALEATGELERTLIVFTADNGFMHGQHRRPSGKNLPYEPSIRVPLVMRGPGIPRGVRVSRLVGNIDLAPTIVDAADAQPLRRMDGRSLLPLVADAGAPWRTAVLLERTGPQQPRAAQRNPGFTAVRTARYSWVEYATGERELYDLAADPHQLRSRHADPRYAKLRADLARRLAALRRCAGTTCG